MKEEEEEEEEPSTKVVAEHRCQRLSGKDNIFTYQVDQNRTGDTFNKLDLAEISDSRVDQEPEINIRDCIKLGVLILILSHNCIRKLKSYKR